MSNKTKATYELRKTVAESMKSNAGSVSPFQKAAIYRTLAIDLETNVSIERIREQLFKDYVHFHQQAIELADKNESLTAIQGTTELANVSYTLWLFMGRYID